MNSRQETYFVTGAAGFIGSHICIDLLTSNKSAKVIGIDNLNTYYSTRIKLGRLKNLNAYENFQFYKENILNSSALKNISNRHKPTHLIHAAAEVGVRNGEHNPFQYYSTNVLGTESILDATKNHISHAIVLSSSSVYGNGSKLPFSEVEHITLSSPISIYGASKACMEIVAKKFFDSTKIATTIIRPFSVYGPNGRPDMLPIKMLISSLNNVPIEIYEPHMLARDWTYIDDFVGLLRIAVSAPNNFQVMNIGSGFPMLLQDVLDIAQDIIKKNGRTLQYTNVKAKDTEMIQTWADNTKILELGGKKSFTSFAEGFNKTAEFFFSRSDEFIV